MRQCYSSLLILFASIISREAAIATTVENPTESSTTAPPANSFASGTRYKVAMTPNFVFGVLQFRPAQEVSPTAKIYCPKNYCVDRRFSDAATCVYPPPIDVKKCLDASCRASPKNMEIRAQTGEDSYCKDFMPSQKGRVCQWTTDQCTCNQFDLTYVDGVVDKKAPRGWKLATPCEYTDNYKAGYTNADGSESKDSGPRASYNVGTTKAPQVPVQDAQNAGQTNSAGGMSVFLTLVCFALIIMF